jgi:hypothetical protein
MLHDLVRFFRTWRLARRRPRVFGPAVLAAPMVVVPLLAGFVWRERGAAIAAAVTLTLVVAYAVARLHPLVRFIPPPKRARTPIVRVLAAVFRRPVGAMLIMSAGVYCWMMILAVLFNERLSSEPFLLVWVVLLFGTLGGLSWWEIFYGRAARKAQARSRRADERAGGRGAKRA